MTPPGGQIPPTEDGGADDDSTGNDSADDLPEPPQHLAMRFKVALKG